jgi:hypothetical protein
MMEIPKKLHWNILLIIFLLAGAIPSCSQNPHPPSRLANGSPGELSPTKSSPDEKPPEGDQARWVDLVPARVSVDQGETPRQVKIKASVRNKSIGKVDSDFDVVWYPSSKSDEVGCSWHVIPARINHEKQILNCVYTYPAGGEMHWQLVVDPDQTVSESDEKNNVIRGAFNIENAAMADGLTPPVNCGWQADPTPGRVILNWEYTGPADIDGFVIYLGSDNLVQWADAGSLEAIIEDLNIDKGFHFDVRAYKGDDLSPVDACFVDVKIGN